MEQVRCQESFASLIIAEQAQNEDRMHKLVDHEVFSGINPAEFRCDKKLSKSSKCYEQEISAILDSWHTYIAYEVETSRYAKPRACGPTSATYSECVFEPVRRIDHSGPPKQFRRRCAMWETMTRRMVGRANEAVLGGHGPC
jgi:hypothetical protein